MSTPEATLIEHIRTKVPFVVGVRLERSPFGLVMVFVDLYKGLRLTRAISPEDLLHNHIVDGLIAELADHAQYAFAEWVKADWQRMQEQDAWIAIVEHEGFEKLIMLTFPPEEYIDVEVPGTMGTLRRRFQRYKQKAMVRVAWYRSFSLPEED